MNGKPRTKEQAKRFEIIARELGCEACNIENGSIEPAHIHHVDTIKQNHDHVFGLCPWHHIGEGMPLQQNRNKDISPHLKQRGEFTRRYGSQEYLEERCRARYKAYQVQTIGGKASPWPKD